MKRQFTATVVGVSPATTSDFNGGAHTVTMALDGQGSCAPMPTNIELPLFNAEEARALGSLYRIHHAVLVTFETSGAPDVPEEKAGDERSCEGDRGDLAHSYSANGFIQVGVLNGSESDLCLCPATSEYDPPCPRHGVVGIGVTPRDASASAPAPPMVGNRPSCCAAVRGADEVVWIRHGKWAAGDSMVHRGIFFCPFCGAKLPEVA